jgi:hypothetical protein
LVRLETSSATVDAPVAVDVVVRADELLDLRLAGWLLGAVVEADAGRVGIRVDLQDVQTDRV